MTTLEKLRQQARQELVYADRLPVYPVTSSICQ
jgi:hypothetical protein